MINSSLMEKLRAAALVCALCCGATAHAQTPAYLPEGVSVSIPEVYPSRFSGYYPGVGGSTTPSVLSDGHGIAALYTQYGIKTAPSTTVLTLSGFPADPGPSYVTSLVCYTPSAGTVTLPGSAVFSRIYNASIQTLTYTWRTPSFNSLSTAQTAACTVLHQADGGWVRPKYEVVGLVYAPPGSRSSVTYQNGFQSGTSTSTTNTYSTNYTTKVTVTAGFVAGVLNGTETTSYAAGWGQSTDATNSLTLADTYTTGLVQSGPASSAVGVDHDYDVIYVWLNAEELIAVGGNVVAPNGRGWDERDSAGGVCGVAGISGMDVVALTLGQLKGTQTIPSDLQCRLNRVWDSALGGLTSADFLAIATADPFYGNPSFNPNIDGSGRYELPNGQDLIMNYIPAAPGQQPTGYTYSSSYTTTSSIGKTATDTHSTTYSVDSSYSGTFLAKFTGSLSNSTMFTNTNKNSSTITSGTSQAANFTIYGPASTDNYTGPTAIQVWKDNVYGTFMFFPEN